MSEPRRRPGRPRSEELDAAIDDAVISLLAEVGYGRLRVDDVASRAGVSKPTIYRRAPTKAALAIGVLARLKHHAIQMPDTGSAAGDLRQVVRDQFASLDGTALGGALAGLVAEKRLHPDLAAAMEELWSSRQWIVREIMERGIASGELRQDVDVDAMAELLAAPAYYRLLVMGRPLDEASAERHADALVTVLLARASSDDTGAGLSGRRSCGACGPHRGAG